MREVPVGKYIARIDDEEFAKVSAYTWRPFKGGDPGRHETIYAIAHSPMVDGKRHSVIMHRLIMNAPKGVQVDHHDWNGLNNQKYNLRLATNKKNAYNQRARQECSSQYKGVSLDKRHGTWKSYITVDGKFKSLGQFKMEVDAAKAYDRAAREFFGEFACLNFNEVQP